MDLVQPLNGIPKTPESPFGPIWKPDLYKLQQEAPKPNMIPCDLDVPSKPEHYGKEFHGALSHQQAALLLKEEGDYLVRLSGIANPICTLSFKILNFIFRLRGKIRHYRLFYDGQHYVKDKKFDCIDDLVAHGLVTLHLEAEAGTYIQLMCDEAKYEKSPAYMTLSRFKNRTKPLLTTHQEEETVLYDKPHKFKIHNFKGFNWCEFCRNFLWGLTAQGVKCDDCGFSAHVKCSEKLPPDCCPELKSVRSVFGVDLTAFVRSRKTTRPFVVEKCVQEIEIRGLHVEGLYRISGFADEMDNLRMAFERDGENADISANVYDNINVVAGILKQYFRLLPIPLLTYEVHPKLIKAVELPTLKEQIIMTKEALAHLPPAHYNTLKYLMAHLSKVEEHQAANKMSSYNLSTVFAPTLMPPSSSKMAGSIPDMTGEINSLNLLIHHQKLIFQSAILY
ncbi:beta-chimaerin isoform X1 [Cimex lectularius]|uniref:Beta-chimaerin n=1 Tax=Cimex lectularius TaxID=79782 RepID=A0A8I6SFK8_CIMLE|nr:beta-chimaerin isoform X1 [Cimex lectularius]